MNDTDHDAIQSVFLRRGTACALCTELAYELLKRQGWRRYPHGPLAWPDNAIAHTLVAATTTGRAEAHLLPTDLVTDPTIVVSATPIYVWEESA